jgi:HEAT repeat protein
MSATNSRSRKTVIVLRKILTPFLLFSITVLPTLSIAQEAGGLKKGNKAKLPLKGTTIKTPAGAKKKAVAVSPPKKKMVLTKELGLRAVSDLSHPDWAVREKATQQLIDAGAIAHPYIRQGLMNADPEVRLRCMYIIRRPEILTERLVSQMIEQAKGEKGEKAFYRLVKESDQFKGALLNKIREYAANTTNKNQVQRLAASLDTLSEIVTKDDTNAVMSLLKLNLSDGKGLGAPFPLLVEAIAKLPRAAVLEHAVAILNTADASPNAYQGSQACLIIGEFGNRAQVPDLLKGLTHKGSITRMAVAKALRTMAAPEEDIAKLTPLLEDEDTDAILLVLDIFAEFQCKNSVPEILKALDNESETVVQKAIFALGAIADPRAAIALNNVLWPKVKGTPAEKRRKLLEKRMARGNAAWALARMQKCSAAELIALIGAKQGLDYKAFLALAEIGNKDAVDHLKYHAEGGPDNNIERRRWALRALGHVLKNPDASQFLYDQIKTPAKLPATLIPSAINSLRDQNSAVSRHKLVQLLDDTRSTVLNIVYDALGDLEVQEAVPKLIKKLKARNSSSNTFNLLTTALGNLGGKDAIDALKTKYQAQRHNSTMKRYCAWALARAGERSFMKEIVKETRKSAKANRTSLNQLGIDYLYAHDWKNANMTFRRMLWFNPNAQFSAYNLACVQGLKKDRPRSLRLLRRSINAWPSYWIGKWRHVATDPDLKSLHSEESFKRIVKRLRYQYIMSEGQGR